MSIETQQIIHVVMIEDNRHDIIAYKRILEKSNEQIQATYFTRAEDALAEMPQARNTVDVLVTDNRLPGISGTELCKIIRENENNTPLVLLVGDGCRQYRELAEEIGIDECLSKEDFLREPHRLVELIVRLAKGRRES